MRWIHGLPIIVHADSAPVSRRHPPITQSMGCGHLQPGYNCSSSCLTLSLIWIKFSASIPDMWRSFGRIVTGQNLIGSYYFESISFPEPRSQSADGHTVVNVLGIWPIFFTVWWFNPCQFYIYLILMPLDFFLTYAITTVCSKFVLRVLGVAYFSFYFSYVCWWWWWFYLTDLLTWIVKVVMDFWIHLKS